MTLLLTMTGVIGVLPLAIGFIADVFTVNRW